MAIMRTIFIIAITLALAITLTMKTLPAPTSDANSATDEHEIERTAPANTLSPSRSVNRFLANKGGNYTNPRHTGQCKIDNEKCKHNKHTEEGDENDHRHHRFRCCNKKCMDLSSDPYNCGECNNRCAYTDTCCGGKCVTLTYDKSHCGGCYHQCPKTAWCVYGLCRYA